MQACIRATQHSGGQVGSLGTVDQIDNQEDVYVGITVGIEEYKVKHRIPAQQAGTLSSKYINTIPYFQYYGNDVVVHYYSVQCDYIAHMNSAVYESYAAYWVFSCLQLIVLHLNFTNS